MAAGGNGKGGGQPGPGGKPKVSGAFAAYLRHYLPLNEGSILDGSSGLRHKNFGQWKFPGTRGIGASTSFARCAFRGRSGIGITLSGAVPDGILLNTPTSAGENLGKQQTVGAWVRPNVAADGFRRTIISKGTGNDRNFHLYLGLTTGLPTFLFNVGGVSKFAIGTATISTKFPMTLLVGTYDGVTIKIYEDGKLIGSTAETGTPDTNPADIMVGYFAVGGSDNSWNGDIADAFILNRALNQGEIIRLVALGIQGAFPETPQTPSDPLPPAPPAGGGYGRIITPTATGHPALTA